MLKLLSTKGRGRVYCSSNFQDNIFKLNHVLKAPKLEVADIERILYNKFHRVHDIDFDTRNNTVHLRVNYRSPDDPVRYHNKVLYLVQLLDLWDCGRVFINKVESCEYPNYIIDNETMEVIDLPVDIDLDIPWGGGLG